MKNHFPYHFFTPSIPNELSRKKNTKLKLFNILICLPKVWDLCRICDYNKKMSFILSLSSSKPSILLAVILLLYLIRLILYKWVYAQLFVTYFYEHVMYLTCFARQKFTTSVIFHIFIGEFLFAIKILFFFVRKVSASFQI